MTPVPAWPEPAPAPVDWLSHSTWARIRRCGLRAAFARDDRTNIWDRPGPAAALGTLRHRLAEEAATLDAGTLNLPADEWVRRRFDELPT